MIFNLISSISLHEAILCSLGKGGVGSRIERLACELRLVCSVVGGDSGDM